MSLLEPGWHRRQTPPESSRDEFESRPRPTFAVFGVWSPSASGPVRVVQDGVQRGVGHAVPGEGDPGVRHQLREGLPHRERATVQGKD